MLQSRLSRGDLLLDFYRAVDLEVELACFCDKLRKQRAGAYNLLNARDQLLDLNSYLQTTSSLDAVLSDAKYMAVVKDLWPTKLADLESGGNHFQRVARVLRTTLAIFMHWLVSG